MWIVRTWGSGGLIREVKIWFCSVRDEKSHSQVSSNSVLCTPRTTYTHTTSMNNNIEVKEEFQKDAPTTGGKIDRHRHRDVFKQSKKAKLAFNQEGAKKKKLCMKWEDCSYSGCVFEHDVEVYLKEKGPDRGEECPTFRR